MTALSLHPERYSDESVFKDPPADMVGNCLGGVLGCVKKYFYVCTTREGLNLKFKKTRGMS